MRALRIAVVLVALAACGRNPFGAGTFQVNFSWKDGAPPSFQWPVYIFAEVQDLTHPSMPVILDAPAAVAYTPGLAVNVPFSNIPTGSDRVVIANVRQTADSNAQIIAYGESQQFSIVAGQDTVVAVALGGLQAAPGTSTSGTNGISVAAPFDKGYVNRTALNPSTGAVNVGVVLRTDTGVKVRLANSQSAIDNGQAQDYQTISLVPPDPGVSGAGGLFTYQGWNLNALLPSAETEGCQVMTAQTGCERDVFAQFVDANGYASPVTTTGVIVDLVPPTLGPITAPAAYGLAQTISFVLDPSEILSSAKITVTPALGFSSTGDSFSHLVTAADAAGEYAAQWVLIDLAGNPSASLPSPAWPFRVDPIKPEFSPATGVWGGPSQQHDLFSQNAGHNSITLCTATTKPLATGLIAAIGPFPLPAADCMNSLPAACPAGLVDATYSNPYSCVYVEDGLDGLTGAPTTYSVSLAGSDEAGNSNAASTPLTLDYSPPALLSMSGPLTTVGVGDTAVLFLTPSKVLAGPPVVTGTLGALTLPFSWISGTGFSFQAVLPATPAVSGQMVTAVDLTDLVGNTASPPGPSFAVDTGALIFVSPPTASGGAQEPGQSETFSECGATAPPASCVQTAGATWNLVTLSFSLNKPLPTTGTPPQLTASIGAATMTCLAGGSSPGPYPYTCSYTVETADGSGEKTITVSAVDEAGNKASASTSVLFDVTPLSLSGTVVPNPVNAIEVPVLTVSANKTLTGPPGVTVSPTPASASLGAPVVMPNTGPATTWTYGYSSPPAGLDAQFHFTVSDTDPVGHVAALSLPSESPLVVDQVPPRITAVQTTGGAGGLGQDFSACAGTAPFGAGCDTTPSAGYDLVTLTFAVSKPPAALHVTATVGGQAMGCQPQSSSGPTASYVCTYAVAGTEAQGAQTVLITAVDEAGNVTSASTSITFDFTPPGLASPLTVSYTPGPSNVLSTVTAATVQTTINASFALSEPLLRAATVGTLPGGLHLTPASVSGTFFIYEGSVTAAGSPPDGPYQVSIQATDVVGNTATITPATPTVIIDTTAPIPPATTTPDSVIYTRIPWGDNATGSVPAFSVTGIAGAVPDAVAVIAYDGSQAPILNEIGRAFVEGTGAFAITLKPSDRVVVDVSAVDEAGNLSVAAPVLDVQWTASYGGKVSGSTAVNPHVLQEATDFVVNPGPSSQTFVGPVVQDDVNTALEPASYIPVQLEDKSVDTVAAVPTYWWQRIVAGNPSPRRQHTLDYDALRGRLVLLAGVDDNGDLLTDNYDFDGRYWSLATPLVSGPALPPRFGHGAVFDAARGVTVIFGGCTTAVSGACPAGNLLADTWEWNRTVWVQRQPVGPAPSARSGVAMAYDSSRGRVILFGGNDGTSALNDTWEWDGTAWTLQAPVSGAPSARVGAAMTYDPVNQDVLLFGGDDGSAQGDTWAWNGVFWTTLTSQGGTPPARQGLALAYDAALLRTVMFGGEGSVALLDTWTWDGATWRNASQTGGEPSTRWNVAMASDDATRELVLFGGLNGVTSFTDTVTWGGYGWLSVSPATVPPARSGQAMVYDSARNRVVMFGGQSDLLVESDTWEWDGSNWSNPSNSGPDGRWGHAMAYDAALGKTVLFGGYNLTGGAYADTWEWDGSNWSNIVPGTFIPGARFGHMMAYDADSRTVLLFGGETETTELFYDTWQWDGTNWTQWPITAREPGARASAGIAYDSTVHAVMMYSGNNLNDSWQWEPSGGWTNVTGLAAPTGRTEMAMAYDTDRQSMVLFGGTNETGNFYDTWESTSQPQRRAAHLATFSLASTGESSLNIQSLTVTASLGGQGNILDLNGNSTNVSGATIAGWDARAGDWQVLASTAAPPSQPTLVTYTAGTEDAARYQVIRPETVNVAVMSTQGSGRPGTPATVALDYLELTVDYRRPGTAAVCNGLSCQCPGPGTDCGGFCVDTSSDPANCSACGAACPPGAACGGGVCQCPGGETLCGNTCVNLSADPANCGTCGLSCPAGGSCAGKTCHCPSGETDCNGTCVNLQSDTNNCGACGTQCIDVPACTNGLCECPTGYDACGSSCVNESNDVNNCGSCGHHCPAAQTCTSGSCECPGSTLFCSNECVNPATDPNNCGGCGDTCASGSICVSSAGYCCPDQYPVFCPGAPGDCWPAESDCNTLINCSGTYLVCAANEIANCYLGCLPNL